MSAFICSDLHISTIAIHIHHLNDNIDIQELADKLNQ
jgi:polysaccharide pyruvyl transferase WcaK-like protein